MAGIVAHTYPEWWLKLTGQMAHWSIDYSRDLMNNMFNKEKIMGMVFNPNDENMVIVFKELLLPIIPGEKPKPEFYRE